MSELRTRKGIDKTKLDALQRAETWTEQARLTTGPGERPWAAANNRILYPKLIKLPESMHLKLKYLVERVPNTSMNQIMMRAIERELDRMIEALDSPP